MIDFRYHLVSLISVFMALAIGIVLGAGPLQNSIGVTLSRQLESLRTDKSNLQRTVDTQKDQLDDGNQYLKAAGHRLLARQLAGMHVVTIRIDDAAGDVSDQITADLVSAGAISTGVLTLTSTWADPAKAADLTRAAADVAKKLGEGVGGNAGNYLRARLGEAVLVSQAKQGGTVATRGTQILTALADAGLVTYSGDPHRRASGAVVVAGVRSVPGSPTDEATIRQQQLDRAYLDLLSAVRDRDQATVLSGPRRSDTQTTLVAALRADADLAKRITGVDDADWTMGQLSTVLGLREALNGTTHQYGSSPDADTVVPASLTASPSASPSPSPTPS